MYLSSIMKPKRMKQNKKWFNGTSFRNIHKQAGTKLFSLALRNGESCREVDAFCFNWIHICGKWHSCHHVLHICILYYAHLTSKPAVSVAFNFIYYFFNTDYVVPITEYNITHIKLSTNNNITILISFISSSYEEPYLILTTDENNWKTNNWDIWLILLSIISFSVFNVK